MNHPEEALASYVDGVATLQERASVEAHLAFCPRCRQDIERARGARDAVSALPEMAAPEGTAAAVLAAVAGLGLDAGSPAAVTPDAPSAAAPDSTITGPDSPPTAAPAATPPPRPAPPRRFVRPRPQAPRMGHRTEADRPAPVQPPAESPDVGVTPPAAPPEASAQAEATAGREAPTRPETPTQPETPPAGAEVAAPAGPEAPAAGEPEDRRAGRPAPHVPSVPSSTAAYRAERRLRVVRAIGAVAAVLLVFGLFGLAVHFAGGGTSTGGGSSAGIARQASPAEAAGKGGGQALVQDQQDYSTRTFASLARQLATEARQQDTSAPSAQRVLAPGTPSPATPRDRALACLQQGTGLVRGTVPFYLEQASYGGEPVYIGAFLTTSTGERRSLLVMAVTVDGCQARQLVHQAL